MDEAKIEEKVEKSPMKMTRRQANETRKSTDIQGSEIGGTQMTLEMTKNMMTDADYKTRFCAEYWQTKIRYDKLHRMLVKWEAGTLNFTPTCPKELLKEQASYMGNYLRILEIRAEMEGVNPFGEEETKK